MIILTRCIKCPIKTIVDPPRVVFRDFNHPQIVEVIQPIEIVNRHHCVPILRHIFTVTERDEFCDVPTASVRARNTRKKAKR